MARGTRSSSFLPTVKCSNCGVQIEISMMGEHFCSKGTHEYGKGDGCCNVDTRSAPPLPQSNLAAFKGLHAASKPSYSNAATLSRPTRLLPPRIDASAASMCSTCKAGKIDTDSSPDQPYLRPDRYAPNGNPTKSRSPSLLSPKSPRQPPFMMPPRSATAPLPLHPPSPQLIAQDCPFPPFPSAKSRSATPTTPTSPTDINRTHSPTPQTLAHTAYFTAPLSPRDNGGRSVLQRMNTIAPGPFKPKATKSGGIKKDHKAPTLSRAQENFTKPAPADMSRISDHSALVDGEDDHIQRPSTAGAEASRKLSLSSISGGPRSLLDRRPPTAPSLPSGASPPRPLRSDGDSVNEPTPLPDLKGLAVEPLRQEHRSHGIPIQSTKATAGNGPSAPLPRRPSAGALHRRPTVSAANRPLDEIGSVSSYKSSKFPPSPPRLRARGPDLDTSRPSEESNDPMHGSTRVGKFKGANPYHTPTESTSSNGSVRSDMKSGSSRSSSALSDASFNVRKRASDRMTRLDDLLHHVQEATEHVAEKEERQPALRAPPLSFSRPLYTRPMEQPPGTEALLSPPESPIDPTIQNGVLSPIPRPSNHAAIPPVPALPAQIPAQRPPPARRATSGNKGNCRGCGEVIKGKSVSSADGRLSGRYHKQCFVCKTCKEPFQTADFYVLNNHPYCERHYHQLNGSLCRACDGGIEGQYLETELKQKFHPGCFTCQVSSP